MQIHPTTQTGQNHTVGSLGPRAAMSPPDSSLHHRVKEEPSSLSHCTLSPLIEQLDHTLSDVSHMRQGDQRTPTEQGCQRSTLGVCRHSLQRARDSDYLRLHGAMRSLSQLLTSAVMSRSGHRWSVNKWARLCPSKALFIKTGSGLVFTHRL